jgi:uncharacterized zinc-type alcohol dehydrogenase-like protein
LAASPPPAPPSQNSKTETSSPSAAWSTPIASARNASADSQYCEKVPVLTYNGPDKHLGGVTYGGYSESIVVDEAFVLKVPSNLDHAAAAPLLCAGITTFSPLHHWKVGPGQKVGIVGLGGLGHMGVKFAHAFGAHTVLFTTSANKVEDGKRLGADEVVISKDAAQMQKHAGSFNFILDCVSADHDINAYINLLAVDGNIVLVGAPEKPIPVSAFSLLFGRRSLAGSAIGGVRETQEMLDFCGKHNIVCDIETIAIQQVNEAYDRLLKSDVKYRCIIDMRSHSPNLYPASVNKPTSRNPSETCNARDTGFTPQMQATME